MEQERLYATGRRKCASARVHMQPGTGEVTVNHRTVDEYFRRETLKMVINQPFELTDTQGHYDVYVNVRGGGLSGQAGAITHGISRALASISQEHRETLKKAGFLTRDARIKERKKYGQRGARARFQYSKR